MDNLVIIGNGFDLAHGMKTSYKDFTDWIIDGANQNKEEFESITRRTRNDPSQEHLISLKHSISKVLTTASILGNMVQIGR
jgi:hypothetical protein